MTEQTGAEHEHKFGQNKTFVVGHFPLCFCITFHFWLVHCTQRLNFFACSRIWRVGLLWDGSLPTHPQRFIYPGLDGTVSGLAVAGWFWFWFGCRRALRA